MNSVSIIMPLKNGMPLKETLDSIKNQTFQTGSFNNRCKFYDDH